MLKHLLMVSLFLVAAADWPQWLGPNRDNTTKDKVEAWKEAPAAAWRVAVEEGHSSPVVAGGRVFLHTKVKGKNEERLSAYSLKSGELEWAKTYEIAPFFSLFGNGPRGTPAVVDGKVYTLGITGVVSCFSADKGAVVWQVDLLKKLEATNLLFGISGSPLVVGDVVVVNVGSKKGAIVGLDKNKGDVVWKMADQPASYSSPTAITKDGKTQVLVLAQKGLIALDPKDGSKICQFDFTDKANESSITPVPMGDLVVIGSITRGCVALKSEVADGKPTFKEEWKNDKLTCYFSTPVPVGADHLYVVTGVMPPAKSLIATLHCIDSKKGEVLWSKKNVGKYHASLLRTGDDKLLMLEDSGDLVLVDPNPKEFKELARSKVCGSTWAHPALVDGFLVLRDEKELVCLKL